MFCASIPLRIALIRARRNWRRIFLHETGEQEYRKRSFFNITVIELINNLKLDHYSMYEQKEETSAQEKSVVRGTDADLRKLGTGESKAILKKFGVPESEVTFIR